MKYIGLSFLSCVAAACASGGGVGGGAPELPREPRIALAQVGDSVVYVEQTNALTEVERPTGDSVRVSSRHVGVVHVVRTAPDTLEAFYEHLQLSFRGGNATRNLTTQPLLWQRFVLHEDRGRVATVSSPAIPQEVGEFTDLARQFEEFFLRLPDVDLVLGAEWVDTARTASSEGERSYERTTVTRYRVTGDTVVHGIGARRIDYESVIEQTVRSGPTTRGTLTSSLVGEEAGSFVFAPERRVMLARERTAVLEGEIVVQGNLETERLPQSFGYDSRIELLPPATPSAEAAQAPAPEPF